MRQPSPHHLTFDIQQPQYYRRGLSTHPNMCGNVVFLWDACGSWWMWARHIQKYEGKLTNLCQKKEIYTILYMLYFWFDINAYMSRYILKHNWHVLHDPHNKCTSVLNSSFHFFETLTHLLWHDCWGVVTRFFQRCAPTLDWCNRWIHGINFQHQLLWHQKTYS